MKMIVNQLRRRCRDALDIEQVIDTGARYRLGGAEMVQQRPLARRPYTGNFIKRVADQFLLAPGAVGANGKAVRLVA